MKIKRDKDKKELTPEEKELKDLKRAKNIGLAALGTGGASVGLSVVGKKINLNSKASDPKFKTSDKDIKALKYVGLGLGAVGAGLHGISAVKYRKLKKKLKKQQEEEKNDNPEKSEK